MTEWDTETIRHDGGYSDDQIIHGLELDDGTYLKNNKTVLKNHYGDQNRFELFGEQEYRWWGWGPYDMTVILTRRTIQEMFDAGVLMVVDAEANEVSERT